MSWSNVQSFALAWLIRVIMHIIIAHIHTKQLCEYVCFGGKFCLLSFFFLLKFDIINYQYTSLAWWPDWCLITHTEERGLSSKCSTERFTPFKFWLDRLRQRQSQAAGEILLPSNSSWRGVGVPCTKTRVMNSLLADKDDIFLMS